jgi:hypothetical protein
MQTRLQPCELTPAELRRLDLVAEPELDERGYIVESVPWDNMTPARQAAELEEAARALAAAFRERAAYRRWLVRSGSVPRDTARRFRRLAAECINPRTLTGILWGNCAHTRDLCFAHGYDRRALLLRARDLLRAARSEAAHAV